MLIAPVLSYFFIFIIILLLLSFPAGKSPPTPSLFCSPPVVVVDDDYHNNNHPLNSLPKPRTWLLGFGTVNTIATVVTILLTLLNILVYKLSQLHEVNFAKKAFASSSLPSKNKLCRLFSFAEILSATNHFDDSLVIGRGGFGKVYKGSIDDGANTVAIKRLNSMSKQGAPEFWTEITMLSKFRHSHLVSLIGYCESYNEMIIVYEYMVHGTIADHLYKIGEHDNTIVPLCWVQRLKICIGAARGLDYLHTGTSIQHRVIHRDVKSSNILLDENWAAKISDFGLSKIGPANQSYTQVSTQVKGTCGYLDPEYVFTRRITRKSDVYAFGVVLFEVLCGRPAVDLRLHNDQRCLATWAQYCVKEGIVQRIIDPNLKWEILSDSLSAFVKIADKCLHVCPKERPTMTEVVAELEFALTLQERRDYSMAEEYIFNDGEAPYSQEIADSSRKEEVVISVDDGEHRDKKIGTKFHVGRMKFAKKFRLFFSVAHQPVPCNNAGYYTTEAPNDTVAALNGEQAVNIELVAVPSVQLDELKEITENFGPKSLICEGTSGKLYNGILKSGEASCIKKLDFNKLPDQEFLAQVSMVSRLKHENVVELLSYCIDGGLHLIAYEYAPNGSLHDILHGKQTSAFSL
ncbi:hypothetical protein LguiA_001617 [Lonicera macranthoides]